MGAIPPWVRPGRALWGGPARGCAAVLGVLLVLPLAVARGLTPDPRGYGTHHQLGMPPCAFRSLTGLPCPTCGMTTAYAHVVRGEWIRAFSANAAGALIALGSAPLAIWLCWSAGLGRPLGMKTMDGFLWGTAGVLAALTLLTWIVRLFRKGVD